MANKPPYRNLVLYCNTLERSTQPFFCPHCSLDPLPKDYEKHCRKEHSMDAKISCVWCLGQHCWPRGCKYEHARHLIACFREFAARKSVAASPPVLADLSQYTLYDTTSQCEPRELLGRIPRLDLPSRSYLLTHVTPLSPDSLYRHEGLNLAVACVRLFLQKEAAWFLLMVRAVALQSFLEVMDEQRGECTLLPFSCWCDGSTEERDEQHRHHRHVIVVAPSEAYFMSEVYHRISTPTEDCKGCRPIWDALDLIRALGYVSRRESCCQFTLKDTVPLTPGTPRPHYYIFTPLPVDYEKVLVLQWPEGLKTYIHGLYSNRVSIPRLLEQPIARVGGYYVQKLKYFYRLERHRLLPVQKRYAPTTRETPDFVFLYNGSKLHFEASSENEELDEQGWIRKQVEGGNCFDEGAVGEETWEPTRVERRFNKRMKRV